MKDELLRNKMVTHQIEARGVKTPSVLDAMRTVPRHEYIKNYPLKECYADYPLSIGEGQTISQPYIVAYMIEQLNIQSTDICLEVGSGCGYASAIMGQLAREVHGIELKSTLYMKAIEINERLNYTNLHFHNKDGTKGLKEYAPFDKILISAATSKVPHSLLNQLKINGQLIAPIGNYFMQYLMVYTKINTQEVSIEKLIPVRFVPLV